MSTGVEIEKKYVIKMPRLDEIRSLAGFSESQIVQTYISSLPGVTHRVRKRVTSGECVYTETVKKRIDKMSSLETEENISNQHYEELIKNIREGSSPIIKTRICFPFEGHIFEIDIYPEWKKSCILEIELQSKDEVPKLPDFLELVADVTGKREYSNSSMSNNFPPELI